MEAQTVSDPPRWASEYPELGFEELPIEPYLSERYFEQERERIFRKVWLNVGRMDDCPEPGCYFMREVEVCGASVLITHGFDGSVRAFYNVCSHRANKLVWTERGKAKYLTCCFHGWSYDIEGNLRGVLDEGEFRNLEKGKLGLTPIACEVWKGFIYINFDPEPEETLLDYLDGVPDALHDYPFDDLKLTFRYDVEEKSNWKIIADSQNEIYHLPALGPVHGSHGGTYSGTEEGYTRLTVFEKFGRHTVWGTGLRDDYEAWGVEKKLSELTPVWDHGFPTKGDVFDFYQIFPNQVIGLLANSVFHYNFWPLAVDRSRWEIRVYYPPAENAADLFFQHYWKAKLRDVLSEDTAGHEQTHAGIATRAKSHFVLGDQEIQIRAFHKTLHSYVSPELA
jgi:phenylpropionate dioxygenase-like ring-hydroxylating dioxygenase large terminal subunit